jgi:ribosomal protein L37AE/L43A
MPTEEKPSRNEEEYFARQNADAIRAMREKLDAERAKQKSVRNCPKCAVPLVEEEIANVKIDRCPQCKGAWLDGGELEQLQAVNASRGASGGVLSSLLRR